LRIFLADTVHRSAQLMPNTVPYNVARIAAYCQAKHPEHSYHLFKDPHELLAQLRSDPPDVLAVSNYFWNTRLNHRILKFAKGLRPGMVTVVGGPNLDRDPQAYQAYAAEHHAYVDFVVVDEGETCFEAIVAAVAPIDHADLEDLKQADIAGTFAITRRQGLQLSATASGDAFTVSRGSAIHVSPSRPRVTSLDELPSPYLNGMLDRFLAAGMSPIVESVRGCPYQCAFCEQGSAFFKKLAKLSESRVQQEIEYIRGKTATPQLIFADVNFGILKRDLDVAKFLKASFAEHGWPGDLYLYNAKVPTPAMLECMETLHPMAALCMAFQSTDMEVLRNIHRENIGYDKYSFVTKWAKKKQIPVGTELIYGLPGETRKTFIDGYETLLGFRADYMMSYNLRLFGGTELNSPAARSKYAMTTRFRPMDANLGEYAFENRERILEVEEVVLANNTLSADDFFHVRKMAFLVESLWNTGYLRPALAFLANHGLRVMDIFDQMLAAAGTDPDAEAFFGEYESLAREELTEDASVFADRCKDDAYWEQLTHGRGVNMKLNLAFAGRLMFFQNNVERYLHRTLAEIGTKTLSGGDAEMFADVLEHCRAAKFDLDHPEPRDCLLRYDVPAWIEETYPRDAAAFRLEEREAFRYSLGPHRASTALRIKERMGRAGASLSATAERMMREMPQVHLGTRTVARVSRLGPDRTAAKPKLAERIAW
jgi:radical SAM superfamily enzyme YgiQ (UPF0313 family)